MEEKLVDVLPDRVDARAPDYIGNREGLTAQLTAISELPVEVGRQVATGDPLAVVEPVADETEHCT